MKLLRREPRAVYRVYGEEEFLANPTADLRDRGEPSDEGSRTLDSGGPSEGWSDETVWPAEDRWPTEDSWPTEAGLDALGDLTMFPPAAARERRMRRLACTVMLGMVVGAVGGLVAINHLRPATAGDRRSVGPPRQRLAQTALARAISNAVAGERDKHLHGGRGVRRHLAAPRRDLEAPRGDFAAPRRDLEAPRRDLEAPRGDLAAPRKEIPHSTTLRNEDTGSEAPQTVLRAQAPPTTVTRPVANASGGAPALPHSEFGFER
jgi:hypothetical protein